MVTVVALDRQVCRLVVRDLGVQIIVHVARGTLRAETHELPGRRALMTGIAFHGLVGSHQGKAILVLLDGSQRNAPPAYGVARFAFAAELPPMDVGVAVCTLRADLTEDELYVAVPATDRQVHSA